mgnify:CR=1 FL=1
MFVQIKAIPPSERPQGFYFPYLENLYICDGDPDPSFYTIDYVSRHNNVVVTADHSSMLRQKGTHYIGSYYEGPDGLYLAWMIPEDCRGEYEAPKYNDLVYPYKG